MRLFVRERYYLVALLAGLLALSGCGYHTLGAATHLPPDVKTISVPLFATRTEAYHTETAMTNAVIREFASRTRYRITPVEGTDADAVLHGTILKEAVAPLTYNSSTQQSSSFLITISRLRYTRRAGWQGSLSEPQLRVSRAVPVHHRSGYFYSGRSGRRGAHFARFCTAACGRCAGKLLSSGRSL